MKNKKRILVLPHIGTAYGHLIRTAEYIDANYKQNTEYDIYMAISDFAIDFAKNHIPNYIHIVKRNVRTTVNNEDGVLDIESFKKLFDEDAYIVSTIDPVLIISDPGIQAAILWYKFKIPWIGIVHGCYLPKPVMLDNHIILADLIEKTWSKIELSLDKLIQVGTQDKSLTWSIVQKTGQLVVPNFFLNEPLSACASYINNPIKKIGWVNIKNVELLITCGSSGEIAPSDTFINRLSNFYSQIVVAGKKKSGILNGIHYVGNNVNYESLVGENTTVITHAGHGTLKTLSKAKRIIMIPSDLDQLSNAIIAHLYNKWELIFDKNWFEVLDSPNPFYRQVIWENINIFENNNEPHFSGMILNNKEMPSC